MIDHTLLLVYLIASTIGLTLTGAKWSSVGIDLFVKVAFLGTAFVGCILILKFAGLI